MKRAALLALVVAACAHDAHTTVIATADPAAYPCVLREPEALGADFSVRQHLTVHARKPDGSAFDGELDAVLQKQGDTLLVVGLGPMSVKAFTLAQRHGEITFQQFYGPELPFSPRNIVVDIHRMYFKHLPAPAEPAYTGVIRGELDGEHVEETWQGGALRDRVFTRPGQFAGAVRIELGAGCTAARCQPATATLRNEWFAYTLAITSDDYEAL
ncbi:MAG TPA: DUF3261 domain-containing protein [Kofleriaceae bacterium]|nr:DUF3261 domain-containing protein [Kofleriaceae bacterium]